MAWLGAGVEDDGPKPSHRRVRDPAPEGKRINQEAGGRHRDPSQPDTGEGGRVSITDVTTRRRRRGDVKLWTGVPSRLERGLIQNQAMHIDHPASSGMPMSPDRGVF